LGRKQKKKNHKNPSVKEHLHHRRKQKDFCRTDKEKEANQRASRGRLSGSGQRGKGIMQISPSFKAERPDNQTNENKQERPQENPVLRETEGKKRLGLGDRGRKPVRGRSQKTGRGKKKGKN